MMQGYLKLGSDSKKRLVAKPEIVREEAEMIDLRKVEARPFDFIEAKIDARKRLFDKKYFLK